MATVHAPCPLPEAFILVHQTRSPPWAQIQGLHSPVSLNKCLALCWLWGKLPDRKMSMNMANYHQVIVEYFTRPKYSSSIEIPLHLAHAPSAQLGWKRFYFIYFFLLNALLVCFGVNWGRLPQCKHSLYLTVRGIQAHVSGYCEIIGRCLQFLLSSFQAPVLWCYTASWWRFMEVSLRRAANMLLCVCRDL